MGTYSELDIQRKSEGRSKNARKVGDKVFVTRKFVNRKSKKTKVDLNAYGKDWKKEFAEKESVLKSRFEQVNPIDFYRDLFSRKPIQKSEKDGYKNPKWTCSPILYHEYYKPIQVDLDEWLSEKRIEHRMVFDDYAEIKRVIRYKDIVDWDENDIYLKSEWKAKKGDTCYLAPVSYIGQRRLAKYARWLYSITLDIDFVTAYKLKNMLLRFQNTSFLTPTYIVNSGIGVHLYYVLKEPIPLYGNHLNPIKRLKQRIADFLWYDYSEKKNKVDPQTATEAFRLVGSCNKFGKEVTCYRLGEPINLKDLDETLENCKLVSTTKKFDWSELETKYTKEECKEKFPEWYAWKFEGGSRPQYDSPPMRGRNVMRLYETLKDKIVNCVSTGHRFWSMVALFADAAALRIDKEDAIKFAENHLEWFNHCDDRAEKNPFTMADVMAASEFYDKSFNKCLTLNTLNKMLGIQIEPAKRNGNSQEIHCEIMRNTYAVKRNAGLSKDTRFGGVNGNKSGRKSVEEKVRSYLKAHPNATPKEIMQEENLSKNTVYKWYNAIKSGDNENNP